MGGDELKDERQIQHFRNLSYFLFLHSVSKLPKYFFKYLNFRAVFEKFKQFKKI